MFLFEILDSKFRVLRIIVFLYKKYSYRIEFYLIINQYFTRETRDAYLTELARDNTQILINAIWQLPTHRVEEVVVATFPPPTYKLPREKPLPEPKAETKWEKYAKEKGIIQEYENSSSKGLCNL